MKTRNQRKQRKEEIKTAALVMLFVTMIVVLWLCTLRAFALAAW